MRSTVFQPPGGGVRLLRLDEVLKLGFPAFNNLCLGFYSERLYLSSGVPWVLVITWVIMCSIRLQPILAHAKAWESPHHMPVVVAVQGPPLLVLVVPGNSLATYHRVSFLTFFPPQ